MGKYTGSLIREVFTVVTALFYFLYLLTKKYETFK